MPELGYTTERHEFKLDRYKPDHLQVTKSSVYLDIARGEITISDNEHGLVQGTPEAVIHTLQQLIDVARFAKQRMG